VSTREWALDPASVRRLLDAVAEGHVPPEEALDELRDLPFADLGELRIDHHRQLRSGIPEIVFGAGKTPGQCARALSELLRAAAGPVVATRVDPAALPTIREAVPDATYDEVSRVVVARRGEVAPGRVAVVCAGTADLPVGRECAVVLDALGTDVDAVDDVGVAGAHRLFAVRDRLREADVLVVVAGMEGALPTLVAGLLPQPIVAVPTSVGYGAAFDGLAALLGMLNSCAPGVTVVNIDGGTSAALSAARILRSIDR
jgi:pyridinium-3,5-biscarboxylic acid mononucleotide synthase